MVLRFVEILLCVGSGGRISFFRSSDAIGRFLVLRIERRGEKVSLVLRRGYDTCLLVFEVFARVDF